MKKQFARVLSFVMALMMVVTTFGTMGIFAETCAHENKTETVHEPQCNALGFTTVVCNDCNYTWTKDVKAKVECKGETVEAEEATCTTPAYSAGERCIWCDEIISGCEVVAPALGHAMAYVTIDASCTEINRIEYACTRCDYNEGAIDIESIIDQYIPEAEGHQFVYSIVTAPTCTVRKMVKTGKNAELYTSGTKKGLPKEAYLGRAFRPIDEQGNVSDEWWIVEGVNGKAVYECVAENCEGVDCDRAYIEIVVLWNDSLHNFTNATQTYGKDDCFGAYYEWEECKICGFNKYTTEDYTQNGVSNPFKNDIDAFIKTDDVKHNFEIATDSEAIQWGTDNPAELAKHGLTALKGASIDATCYEKGYTLKHCDKCDTYQFNVTSKSHNFTSANCTKETVAATCTTPGGTRIYCANGCGATEFKKTEDAWGHDYAFSCEDGCPAGECYDCTHKNRVGTCVNEYVKPGETESSVCGAKYETPENHEHVFTSTLYYYWMQNGEIVYPNGEGKYANQISCSVDYYLYKKCECAGKPYHCNATESAGIVPANSAKGTHTWEIVKMTIKLGDCDDDGSFAVACAFCNKADTRSPDYNKDGAPDGIYVGADACKYIVDNYGSTLATATAFEAAYGIDFFNATKKVGTVTYPAHDHNKTDGTTEYACFQKHGHNYEGQEATCTQFGEILVCTFCEAEMGHDMVGKKNPANHDCEQQKFNVAPTCGQKELVITIYGCGAASSVKEQDVLLTDLKSLANHKTYLRYEDGKIWKEVKDEDTGAITVETLGTVDAKLDLVEYEAPKCLEIGNPSYYYCHECRNYLILDDFDADRDGNTTEINSVVARFVLDEENNYVENVHHEKLTANDKGEAVPFLDPTYHVGTVVEVAGVKETCDLIGWTDYAFCTACTENAEVEVLEYTRKNFGAACGDCDPTGANVKYHYTSTTNDKYEFSTKGIVFVRKTADGKWTLSQTSDKLYRPIPAHGDKYQITVTEEEAYAPTCTAAGLEAGTHCKKCCGTYLSTPKNWVSVTDANSPFYIAPLGHDIYGEVNEDNAWNVNAHGQWENEDFVGYCDLGTLECCTKYSYTAIWCTWCFDMDALAWDEVDYTFKNGEYKVPANNSWALINVETLYEHVWGTTEDEEGNTVLDIVKVGPFCTEEGFEYKYCVECDCIVITDVIEATGHYYMNDEEKVILDTSCKANADEDADSYCLGISCEGCGKNLSEDDITHNWAHVELPETCLADGVEFWHCTWCYLYAVEDEDGELVPAEREEAEQIVDNFDGHNFCHIIPDSYVEPTTKLDGQVQYKCARCEETITVILPKLDGALNLWLTTEDVYTYANGDTVYVTLNIASKYEESFEFTAMELFLDYNAALLEYVGYTVNHDDTIATEVAAQTDANLMDGILGAIVDGNVGDVVANVLGNGKIKVLSYATGDYAEIEYDDDAYVTFEFKVKGASDDEWAYVDFDYNFYPVVYDANGEYMDNLDVDAYDWVEFGTELTGDVDRNGTIDIGDMVALNKLAKGGAEYDSVADINKDGLINVKDVMKLRQFLATERTYIDYCAMMGVDFWAEFTATIEEILPVINVVINIIDQNDLKNFIDEAVEGDFEDEELRALASVIDSIEGDITVEQVVAIAQIYMAFLECAYEIPVDTVSFVIGLASVLVAGDRPVGML